MNPAKDNIVKALRCAMLFETIYFANNIVVVVTFTSFRQVYSGGENGVVACFAVHIIYTFIYQQRDVNLIFVGYTHTLLAFT